MPDIDHNLHETRQTNRIWWIIWPILVALWVGLMFLEGPHWPQIALGFITGVVLASHAIEISGNKPPSWWR